MLFLFVAFCCVFAINEEDYCPEGSWEYTEDECTLCHPGRCCEDTGGDNMADNEDACDQGHYCPEGTADCDTNICRAGYYCPRGSFEETICDVGYACPTTGMPAPGSSCDDGEYCPAGTITISLCPEGQYCKRFDPMIPCPEGKMCPMGISDPEDCTPRYYCPEGTGHNTSNLCPEGSWCQGGILQSCPVGYLCPAGAASISQCPYGYFCPEGTGAVAVLPCNCGGRGSCELSRSDCHCDSGFSGPGCDTWTCGGLGRDDPAVCNQLGVCEAPDSCDCEFGWDKTDFCASSLFPDHESNRELDDGTGLTQTGRVVIIVCVILALILIGVIAALVVVNIIVSSARRRKEHLVVTEALIERKKQKSEE